MYLSRQRKIMVAFLTSLFILCVCSSGIGLWTVGSFQRAVITDSDKAHTFGQHIAAYTAPPAYQAFVGLRFLGAEAVILSHETSLTNTMLIVLTSIPQSGLEPEILDTQLQRSVQYQNRWQGLDLALDQTEKRIVNGRETTITFYQGMNSLGQPYQQLTALLQSNQGDIFFLAQGPESAWNQDALDEMIGSIH